ncbi:hypothetical protein BV25DRAFT_538240 [Artomyces pyxidatus]|uniref:Uncharacterized protein n=1 Tax=Artomyces pyxidatus TaxID=48021 RepID=A0ACB8TII6_9AGAM|nr:hypothetical protein BV25DRAFT_538240 [Artomyces pyxidatus]
MSNIAFQSTIEELSEKVFPMWPPGIVHQQRHGHNWHVRFSGAPWNGSGDDSILASRMICMIFWVLAHQGYVYLTSINTGRAVGTLPATICLSTELLFLQLKPPRLVFIRAPSDALAHFFTMTLSNSGDQVTFVNPPAIVTQTLGLTLRAAFPRRIANEHASDDGIFTIQLKSGFSGPGVDKDMFLAHILKHINDCAFKLDASVPMARRGLFGLGGRKELWVFKGSETWWQTRK